MKTILFLAILLFSINTANSQELIPANEAVLDSIKEANKGKVIFFNFWASWCKPCVEEFPDIMQLNNEYKDKDFKLVFISLDFGDDLASKTKSFLRKMNVDFVTYSNGFNKDEDLINYMDKNWEGAIPATFIFDKNGKLRKTLIGKHDYHEFKEVTDKYLM